MNIGSNLLSGLANSAWTAVVTLLVVPFYIQLLGIESYGLIGFYATLQAMFLILDLGLAPTMNREVARYAATGHIHDARYLLRTLSVVYWCMAGCIALALIMLAPILAGQWLKSSSLSQETMTTAITLMGLAVGCRWPIALYQGALMGAQRIPLSSGINMTMITVANVGAVCILAWVSATIHAFFIWHAGSSIVHALLIRRATWNVIGRSSDIRFDTKELKRVWHFTAGMSGVAIAALILTQLDKLILSRIVGLDDFGRYALAGVLASALYVLTTPVFNAVFPHFTTLVKKGDEERLAGNYRMGTLAFSTIIFPAACAISFFSEDLLHLWTGNAELARTVAPIVALLVLGTSINGVMHFPYALQLAYGLSWLSLTISVILVVILVPLIIFMVYSYGVVGGAAAWLLLNGLYLLIGTILTHRYILNGVGLQWMLKDVCLPLVVSMAVMATGQQVANYWFEGNVQPVYRLVLAAALSLMAVLSILALRPGFRRWLIDWYRSRYKQNSTKTI